MSPNFKSNVNSTEVRMKMPFTSWFPHKVMAMLLLGCLLNYLLIPMAIFAQQTSPSAGLETIYESAEYLYKHDMERDAASALEDLAQNPAYLKSDVGFKLKVASLLVKCYYVEKNIDSVKKKLRQMLDLNPNFNFDNVLSDEIETKLVQYLEEVRNEIPPRTPLLFDFRPDFDTSQVVVTKVGKERKLTIRTVPDSVPVTFQLGDESKRWKLNTIDSVSASLLYTPTAGDTGAQRAFVVDAVGRDTTRSLTVTFTVEASKKFPWTIVGGGAAGVGVIALIAVLLSGKERSNGFDSLPGPPNPGTR